eukprot:12538274-Ditylum_brightwellii.AAC.1
MQFSVDDIFMLLVCVGYNFGDMDDVDDVDVWILKWLEVRDEEQKKLHSHLKKEFYKMLHDSSKEDRLCYISRKTLVSVAQYSWRKVLFHGGDGSFITATGMDTAFRRGRVAKTERGHLPLRIAFNWSYCGLGQEVLSGVCP